MGRKVGLAIGVLSFAAACSSGGPKFPASGGGGPHGGGPGGGDGGLTTADATLATSIDGLICVRTDVRLDGCTPPGTVPVRVTVVSSGASATAAASGAFTLSNPGGASLVTLTAVGATGSPLAPSSVSLEPTNVNGVRLPMLGQMTLADLFTTNNVTPSSGTGVLVVNVVQPGQQVTTPIAGATLGAIAGIEPLYDAGDPLLFAPSGPTGAAGTAIYLNLPPGSASTTATFAGIHLPITTTIVDGAVTFATAAYIP